MSEITLYILNTSIVKKNISYVLSYVSKQRREKAEKYVFEKDQLLSLTAGYLLKKFLPGEDIKISNSGKPYLSNGPYFNVSHSGDYAVLAIHPSRDVGVDIEFIDKNRVDAIKYVLNQEESSIQDVNTLFQIWSNKESLIKCISTGLKDIKNVSGFPLEGIRSVGENEYYSKSIVYNGYSLSVTLKGKVPFDLDIIVVDDVI